MTAGIRRWTATEIVAEFGDATVVARNHQAGVEPLPSCLSALRTLSKDPGWEGLSVDIHDPDIAQLSRAWWNAMDKPGVPDDVVLHRRVGDGWRAASTVVLDLHHQSEFAVMLVATTDLGPCEAPPMAEYDRSDEDRADFERPVWVLEEFDQLACLKRLEGDVAEVFGRPVEEVLGQPAMRFIHPDDLGPSRRMWSDLLDDPGGSRTIRLRMLHPDGSIRWIESTLLNRLGADGSGSVMAIAHDITERRHRERNLRELAHTDPLTGLPNRSALDSTLEAILDNGPATVAFVDLDGFKEVNDAMGHHVGDEVLKALALRLQRTCGQGCSVGRWGGDEFVLIGAGYCTDRFLRNIRRAFTDPVAVDDHVWSPHCSFGLAYGQPGDDPDDLIRSADTAMYRSKTGHDRGGSAAERSATEASASTDTRINR